MSYTGPLPRVAHHIVTNVLFGLDTELRHWLRENIGKPCDDWITWPAIINDAETQDHIGVTVYNERHLTLIALRWV